MTSPGPTFQEFTGSCHENVPAPKGVSSNLRSTDGVTVLARIEIVAILGHYQPSYNTLQTMKPSDPLHRGVFCQSSFRWIYYYGSNKPPEKKLANRTSVDWTKFFGHRSKRKISSELYFESKEEGKNI